MKDEKRKSKDKCRCSSIDAIHPETVPERFGSFRNFLLLQLSHVGEAAGGLTVTFAARKIHITQQPGLP